MLASPALASLLAGAPLAGALLATACITAGISRDEAIRRALAQVPAAAQVVSAEAREVMGSSVELNPGEPRKAWIVRLVGNFPLECPAPVAVCPDVHNAEVVLDFYTGEFITASYG